MSQFDQRFTEQTPVDSPDDHVLSESANQIFLVNNKLCKCLIRFKHSHCFELYFIDLQFSQQNAAIMNIFCEHIGY